MADTARCASTCPHTANVSELMEKVITGNGKESLLVRTSNMEQTVDRLTMIVEGDGSLDNPGVSKQMTQVVTGIGFLKWMIGTGLALWLVMATLIGIWMVHVDSTRQASTQPHHARTTDTE